MKDTLVPLLLISQILCETKCEDLLELAAELRELNDLMNREGSVIEILEKLETILREG